MFCDELKTRKSTNICLSVLSTDLHRPRFPTLQISYRHILQAASGELVYKTLAEDGQLCKSAECRHETGDVKPYSACINLWLAPTGSFRSRFTRAINIKASCLATVCPLKPTVFIWRALNPDQHPSSNHGVYEFHYHLIQGWRVYNLNIFLHTVALVGRVA